MKLEKRVNVRWPQALENSCHFTDVAETRRHHILNGENVTEGGQRPKNGKCTNMEARMKVGRRLTLTGKQWMVAAGVRGQEPWLEARRGPSWSLLRTPARRGSSAGRRSSERRATKPATAGRVSHGGRASSWKTTVTTTTAAAPG